jgi:calcium-dependent protein kinase
MIIKQLLSAVHYCHTNNVVHRDLKPENMLIENDKEFSLIKVIDFGTSRIFTNDKKMT